MRRIVSYIISIIFSAVKFSVMKIFHIKDFKFHIPERFSPNVVTDFGYGSKVNIGKNVKARSGTKIQVRKGGTLNILNDVRINYNCIIACHDKVEIGRRTELGPSVYIYDHDHDYRLGLDKDKFITAPVIIGDNCWIGAKTVILRGTTIGNNCVIGAGCIVKGNYPDGSVIIQKRDTTCIDY